MSADTSRSTFRPRRHYSKRISQQGRVFVDADWNEQIDIQRHRECTTNIDVIGQSGVPEDAPGFAIEPTADGTDLQISSGRLYLDGILVECDPQAIPFTVKTNAPLQIQPAHMALDEVAFAQNQRIGVTDETQPDGTPLLFEVTAVDSTNSLLSLNPASTNTTDLATFLATALEPRMQRMVTCTTQPDVRGFALPTAPGRYLAYLHVFDRVLTPLDDAQMIDPALGVDTCLGSKVVWQVGLLQVGQTGDAVACDSDISAWDSLIAASTGELAAQVVPDQTSGLCGVSATGGFSRPSNQHYRVEIHQGGANPTAATMKWQRDNASIVTKWLSTVGNTLTVSSAGRDQVLGFAPGQWVELLSDEHVLAGLPGTLVPLVSVVGVNLTIDPTQATGSVDPKDFASNPQIRRWDSLGAVALGTSFQSLESGIQVKFANGTYKTGDHWLIPARTLTANIEWPTDDEGNALFLPPKGIQHHYCHLAIVEFDGKTWTLAEDCRVLFPPLTGITTAADQGIHIREVLLLENQKPLLNDTAILPADLARGIAAVCDKAVDPESISRATCFVTLELPYPISQSDISLWDPQGILGYQPIIVDATASGAETLIRWIPTGPAGQWLSSMLFKRLAQFKVAQVLVHFTLKGNFIWQNGAPAVYLDGEAFGVRPDNANATAIRFPSGNGKSGGDFEMWFWLNPNAGAVQLKSFAVALAAAGTVTMKIALTAVAPADGTIITLNTVLLDATGATVPGVANPLPDSVTVPAGKSTFATKLKLSAAALHSLAKATVNVTASDGTNQITGTFQIKS